MPPRRTLFEFLPCVFLAVLVKSRFDFLRGIGFLLNMILTSRFSDWCQWEQLHQVVTVPGPYIEGPFKRPWALPEGSPG